MATNNALNNTSPTFTATTSYATTFDTNVAAAGVMLSGTTFAAGGSDTDINITLTPKGAGVVSTAAKINAAGLSFDGGTSVMSAYTLHDVATFTPTISFAGGTTNITYTSATCAYSRIGNICFFQLAIVLSNKGSSTGNLQVNLPLTPAYVTRCNVLASVVTYAGDSMQGQVSTSGYFTIGFSDNAGGAFTTMTNSHCANTTSIRAFGFYWV